MKLQTNLSLRLSVLAFAMGNALATPVLAAESPTVNVAALQQANSPAKPRFSAAQIAEMNARAELANAIVNNVQADATAKGSTASWRVDMLSLMFSAPSATLRNIAASATTLDQVRGAVNEALSHPSANTASAKALGDAADSLVFTPKTPCRFIDTRNTGGAITSPRDYDTFFTGPAYGGASGCTLPGYGEPAFAANVTVIVPAGSAGYLGFRPYGNTAVTSFINWPTSGTPTGLANAGVIATAVNTSNSHYEFEVFEGGGNAPQFALDYFGYFSPASDVARNRLLRHRIDDGLASAIVGERIGAAGQEDQHD